MYENKDTAEKVWLAMLSSNCITHPSNIQLTLALSEVEEVKEAMETEKLRTL